MTHELNILLNFLNKAEAVWNDVSVTHAGQDEFTLETDEQKKVTFDKFPQVFASSTLTKISSFLRSTIDMQLTDIEKCLNYGIENGSYPPEAKKVFSGGSSEKNVRALVREKETFSPLQYKISLVEETQNFLGRVTEEKEALEKIQLGKNNVFTEIRRLDGLIETRIELDNCCDIFHELSDFCSNNLSTALAQEADANAGEIAKCIQNLFEQTKAIYKQVNEAVDLHDQSKTRRSSNPKQYDNKRYR